MAHGNEKEEIILIVDDDEAVCSTLEKMVRKMVEEDIVCAHDGEEAKKVIRARKIMLAIIDYKLPDTSGIELLKLIKSIDAEAPVLILTGYGTIESGINAIKEGAYDYLLKPVPSEKLHALIRGLTNYRALLNENEILKEELGIKYNMGRLVGKSAKIRKIYDLLPGVAQTESTVLVQGESGTGKELIAKTIHHNSLRKDKPFIVADCTILTGSLLESELFGHEKGAFTGAIREKIGRFELADGGTIFLDEIGEVSPLAQLKLLRVLQERSFERVGGEQTIKVDVRVIAATNKDLTVLMQEGKFREDLYYRLNVIPIFMPPLRERREDIPLLAKDFLNRFCKKNDRYIKDMDGDAYRLLIDYDWPGNVRELENVIERAVVVAKGNMISAGDLPTALTEKPQSGLPGTNSLYQNEKDLIARVLERSGYNLSKTAKELEISRSTLYGKMKKYGLSEK